MLERLAWLLVSEVSGLLLMHSPFVAVCHLLMSAFCLPVVSWRCFFLRECIITESNLIFPLSVF